MLHTIHIAGIPHRVLDLSLLSVGQQLTLVREPSNPYDPNAIKVLVPANEEKGTPLVHLGYIPKTETNFFASLPHVYIHSIRPNDKWREVTIGNEAPKGAK